MASKKPGRTIRAVLEYPRHAFKPIEAADFLQLPGFANEWDRLGLDIEHDLRELEIAIMLDPKGYPVVKGTGGLRKLRFSPDGWPRGKSGALRVGYVYLAEFRAVILVVVYRKNERDDLSAAVRKAIREFITRIKAEFARRPIR